MTAPPWIARCPAHADRTPSLHVTEGARGTILLRCFAGCDQRAVLDALREYGLWPDRDGELQGHQRPRHRGEHRGELPRRLTELDPDVLARTEAARAIWQASRPATGTLVEVYLRARSIGLPPRSSLRYHPALRHGPTGLNMPCMVGAVQDGQGRVVAVHRTWLAPDGSGKASVSLAKMTLGPCAGGAVRLAKAGLVLAIGEGIESTLAYMQLSNLPGWAAVSAPGLAGLVLPNLPCAVRVMIAADHDDAGLAAAERSAKVWTAEGRKVRIAPPPEPGADWNDHLKERRDDAA